MAWRSFAGLRSSAKALFKRDTRVVSLHVHAVSLDAHANPALMKAMRGPVSCASTAARVCRNTPHREEAPEKTC
jgi:hypothetical protein